MTALAAKFEAYDSASMDNAPMQALALLLVLTSALTVALLPSLALTGNLLLRYP